MKVTFWLRQQLENLWPDAKNCIPYINGLNIRTSCVSPLSLSCVFWGGWSGFINVLHTVGVSKCSIPDSFTGFRVWIPQEDILLSFGFR